MKKDSLLKHSILIVLSLIWLSPIYLLIVNAFANVETWESNFDWSIKGWNPVENFQQAWTVADLAPGLKSNFSFMEFWVQGFQYSSHPLLPFQ